MAKSKKTEIKDIIIKGKSFIIIGIDYKRREYLEKLVRTNKGRMAKSIEDNLDYLVIGETNDADENKYIKNKFINPAKKNPIY
jgi:NAD-dependent DNA ligase